MFGGSALTADIDVPKERSDAEMGAGIPVTYVPARNTVFLSFALAWAEVLGSSDIFIGVNALDYSGYPDCRPEYIAAFEQMANLATKAGVEGSQHLKIHAPLMQLTKAEIIRRGLELGVDYGMTHSCYDPDAEGRACGHCDSCLLRLRGLRGRRDRRPRSIPGGSAGAGMTYTVKEIFYTLQGEGANAGRPAVFCRFAGCNLWTGREQDRQRAICTFCDTDFVGPTARTAASSARAGRPRRGGRREVAGVGERPIATRSSSAPGGEPLLQLDEAAIDALHARGVRDRGRDQRHAHAARGIDWICVSPKAGSETILLRGSELKLVYPQDEAPPERFADADFDHFYLQPMDGPDLEREHRARRSRTASTHPQWRLSLQTHKVVGIR